MGGTFGQTLQGGCEDFGHDFGGGKGQKPATKTGEDTSGALLPARLAGGANHSSVGGVPTALGGRGKELRGWSKTDSSSSRGNFRRKL